MSHEAFRALLSEFRDEALPAARRQEVAAHVADCASCRAELRDWDRLANAFLRRPIEPAAGETERFVRAVMARLPEPEPARVPFWETLSAAWLVPAFGAACAALLLSFAPSGPRYASAEPLFVADGQDVVIAPAARPASSGLDETLGLGDDAQ